MGIWAAGFFDNDDALDFLDGLTQKGLPLLRRALERQLLDGIGRASKSVTLDEVEAKVQIQLEKHRQQLARGLKVGSMVEAERIWRETFELDARERRVWEIFWFAAAVMILHKLVDTSNTVPAKAESWIIKNEKKLHKNLGDLVQSAIKTWQISQLHIKLIDETLRSNQLDCWIDEISSVLVILQRHQRQDESQ